MTSKRKKIIITSVITVAIAFIVACIINHLIRKHQVDALFEQGLGLAKQGKYVEAEPIYQQVIRLNPKHARALRGLGIFRDKNGDSYQAIYYYQRAAKTDDVKSITLLCGAYFQTEQVDKVAEFIPKLFEYRLDDVDCLTCILLYALKIKDQEMFENALDGVPFEQIKANKYITKLIADSKVIFNSDMKVKIDIEKYDKN